MQQGLLILPLVCYVVTNYKAVFAQTICDVKIHHKAVRYKENPGQYFWHPMLQLHVVFAA